MPWDFTTCLLPLDPQKNVEMLSARTAGLMRPCGLYHFTTQFNVPTRENVAMVTSVSIPDFSISLGQDIFKKDKVFP